jgi:hypothetical protein
MVITQISKPEAISDLRLQRTSHLDFRQRFESWLWHQNRQNNQNSNFGISDAFDHDMGSSNGCSVQNHNIKHFANPDAIRAS